MSIWGALGVIFLIVQFVYENYKKNQQEPLDEIENIQLSDEELTQVEVNDFEGNIKVTQRKIIDRENEIIDNKSLLDKDNFVQDYIMAEILSKPKSKK